jgi:hypothetical protein
LYTKIPIFSKGSCAIHAQAESAILMAFSVELAIDYKKKQTSKFDNNEAELLDLIAQLMVEIIIDGDENDKDLVPEI